MEWRSQRGSTRTRCGLPIPSLFRDEGTWFSRLTFKQLVYMHGTMHVAHACE